MQKETEKIANQTQKKWKSKEKNWREKKRKNGKLNNKTQKHPKSNDQQKTNTNDNELFKMWDQFTGHPYHSLNYQPQLQLSPLNFTNYLKKKTTDGWKAKPDVSTYYFHYKYLTERPNHVPTLVFRLSQVESSRLHLSSRSWLTCHWTAHLKTFVVRPTIFHRKSKHFLRHGSLAFHSAARNIR